MKLMDGDAFFSFAGIKIVLANSGFRSLPQTNKGNQADMLNWNWCRFVLGQKTFYGGC
jgi:hypothetical protein